MFEKILSVLPYNPGLVPQLAFYSRRMREEASIRRIGMVFIVLAFMVQFFAVLSPPQSTSADSNNDMIVGGITSAANAMAHCYNNTRGYRAIMRHYHIDCTDIGRGTDTTITVGNDNYYSAGHHPLGVAGETPVNAGGVTIYFRQLAKVNLSSSYRALHIHNNDGKTFYILYGCGNLVSVGLPVATDELTRTSVPAPAPSATTAPTPAPAPVTSPTTAPTPTSNPTPTTTPTPTPPSTPTSTPVCKYNSALKPDDVNCKPCDKSLSSEDLLACVVVHKTATNVTAGLADANNSTAKASDVITYTLFAQNNGKDTVKDFVFQENIGDVLDYADVTDLHGGTMDDIKVVKWPANDILAGATASQQITVKVKAVIPATPTGSTDPNHFDLIMTNVYGNAVTIKLPGTPIKTVETAAAALPNTGPGTTLFIAASVVMVAGYFFGRARLLAVESDIAIKDIAVF